MNGQHSGTAWVGGGEQLDGGVGIIQAAQRIEARPEEKADVLFAQPGRVQFGQFVDGFQANALSAAKRSQAALKQVTGVAGLESYIGDDAQGDKIKKLIRISRTIKAAEKRFGQLVGHSHTGQGTERVIGGQAARIDASQGRR